MVLLKSEFISDEMPFFRPLKCLVERESPFQTPSICRTYGVEEIMTQSLEDIMIAMLKINMIAVKNESASASRLKSEKKI